MNFKHLCLCILFVSMLLGKNVIAQSVMTYNIKNNYQKTGTDTWEVRKETMVDLLQHYHPDIFGVQEALFDQVDYLDSSLGEYSFVGVGRDDAKKEGEYCAIFFNAEKFKVIKQSTFYLSQTPDKISLGWDAACPRICTYALLQNKVTRKKLWILNTHFDHVGAQARLKSVELILERIAKINSEEHPLVLMGDLNLTPEEKPILTIAKKLSDGLKISKKAFYGPVGTFNSFSDQPIKKRIDYIFVSNTAVESYIHIDDRLQNNRHISDHLPVLVQLGK